MAKMFVLDMETLGTSDNAVVLSIGMTYISPDENVTYRELLERGFYAKLDRKEQIERGRIVEKDTVDWWSQQGEEAREVLSSDGALPFRAWHQTLYRWAKMHGFFLPKTTVLTRGLVDGRWAESLARTFKVTDEDTSVLKFPYWRYRDVRTALDILCQGNDKLEVEAPEFVKHHALCDAAIDGLRMLKAFGA